MLQDMKGMGKVTRAGGSPVGLSASIQRFKQAPGIFNRRNLPFQPNPTFAGDGPDGHFHLEQTKVLFVVPKEGLCGPGAFKMESLSGHSDEGWA